MKKIKPAVKSESEPEILNLYSYKNIDGDKCTNLNKASCYLFETVVVKTEFCEPTQGDIDYTEPKLEVIVTEKKGNYDHDNFSTLNIEVKDNKYTENIEENNQIIRKTTLEHLELTEKKIEIKIENETIDDNDNIFVKKEYIPGDYCSLNETQHIIDAPGLVKNEYVIIKCKICSEIFSDEDAHNQHVKINHSMIYTLNDISSTKTTDTVTHLSTSENKPNTANSNGDVNMKNKDTSDDNEKKPKKITCEICQRQCRSNSAYVVHMRIHTGEKPFSCNLCEYKCADKGNLARHMRSHTGEKPLSCELCKYKCAEQYSLVNHMRVHTGEKPFSCQLCEYKTTRSGHLMRHIRTHTGEKPYSCKVCHHKCADNGSLAVHMRTHTGEKPYSCKLCDHKCSGNGSLAVHMRTHTGEKPFTCHLCEYKCSRSGHLMRHVRTHTGEKPFSCKICNYKCADHGGLAAHVRTHTGEKPYACKLCEYRCAQKSNLVNHMRTHAGIKKARRSDLATAS